MKALPEALRVLFLACLFIQTFAAGGLNTSINIGEVLTTAAATVAFASVACATSADAQVSLKEGGKVLCKRELSKKTYQEKLALFIKYLLENKPDCLTDDHHEELETCHATDKSNARTRKRTNNMPSFLLAALHSIQPAVNGNYHNSPIKIDGGGEITSEVV